MISYLPSFYKKRDWLDKVFDFFVRPLEDDEYGRTASQKYSDLLTGVSKHQLDQRYWRIVHEVVPQKPEPYNFVQLVEEKCDKYFGYMVYTPSPTELIQKLVHFNYNRCW